MEAKINYKEKKLLSESEMMKEEVEFMVESQSLQLKSDILTTKKSLVEAKAELADLKTAYPLNVKTIVAAQLEVEALEDGLKRMEKLQKELGFTE